MERGDRTGRGLDNEATARDFMRSANAILGQVALKASDETLAQMAATWCREYFQWRQLVLTGLTEDDVKRHLNRGDIP